MGKTIQRSITGRALVALGVALLALGGRVWAQVKIMPVGDSITWGMINLAAPPGDTEGYRKILHEQLTAGALSSEFVGPDGTDANSGLFVEGATIGDFLHADSLKGDIATHLTTQRPDIVILHLGTNNVGGSQPIGTFSTPGSMMNQLYTLVTKITNNADVDNLLICKIIPKYLTPGSETETVKYNNALELMLAELTTAQQAKVTLIDMWTPFSANKSTYYNYDVDKVHPNGTGYTAMANIFYHYISKILQPSFTDRFDRAALGAEWTARAGVVIVNKGESGGGALQCTSVGADDWIHAAVWNKTKNLTTVSLKFHATTLAAATEKVGLLVGLDSLDVTRTDGYMVWVYGGRVRIKTVVNGRAGYGVGQDVANAVMTSLVAGDQLKVSYRAAADANYFTIQKNTETAVVLRDRLRLKGNSRDLYSGLMFNQASVAPANGSFIDTYMVEAQLPDVIAPGRIGDLALEFTSNTSVTLGWTAPGNDEFIGRAASYDLRYSTRAITNDAEFAAANIVAGTPAPKDAGSREVFSVSGLQSGGGYYFKMRAVDAWGNKGSLSDAVYAKTNSAGQIVETFDRPTELDGTIGPDWVIDGTEYRINHNPTTNEGELTNYQANNDWGRVAVYRGRSNPSIVKLVWGQNATADGIAKGGLALMLTSPNVTTDGYLLWVRQSLKSILLYDINNGAVVGPPSGQIDQVPYTLKDGSGNPRYPQKGDTMTVVMDWNYAGGHKFDVYINGNPAAERALFDPLSRHNSSTKYSGIMLSRMNGANNVTEFITVAEATTAGGGNKIAGDNQSATVATLLPDSLEYQVVDGNNTPLRGIPMYFKVLEPVDASVSAPPEPVNQIQLETEWAVLSGPYYLRNDDPGASGSQYIVSPIRGGQGKAEFTFYNPKDTTYYFWIRAIAPDNKHYAMEFQLEASGEKWLNNLLWNNWSSQWQWARIRNGSGTVAVARLSKGLHKIILISAHESVKIDKVMLTPNSSYTPTTMEFVPQLLTNENGMAKTALRLGTKAGLNRVEARPFGMADGAIFLATGLPGAPVAMAKSNDGQSGPARTRLPQPFNVTVYDEYGNKVPGAVVNFTLIEGDGTLSQAKDTTDAAGLASTFLTTGIQASTNRVRATFTGYTGPEILFTATVPSGLVTRITGLPGQGIGKHYVGDVLPAFIKARVFDNTGVPLAAVPVTFLVVKGTASPGRIQPKLTDAQGYVTDTLRLGAAAGVVKVLGRIGLVQDTVAADSCFYKASKVEYFMGDRQIATIGDTLFRPLRVKVLDRAGQVVASQPVNFVTLGNGFRFPSGSDSIWVMTNSSGIAGTNVRTGGISGTYPGIVESRVDDGFRKVRGSPISFTLSARSTASRLLLVQGDSTEGVLRELLADPLAVKMVDASNSPVAGQPVDFVIKSGGGKFEENDLPTSAKRVLTDGDGLAITDFRLGSQAGNYNNVIEVSASNGVVPLYGSPAFFRISARSSAADAITEVTNDTLSGTVGKPLAQAIQVRVMDRLGNPVSGETVKFSILSGGGALNGSADTTKSVVVDNAGGIAQVTWTLGPRAGVLNNLLEVTAGNGLAPLNGSPLMFRATGLSDSVSVIRSLVEATSPVKTTEYDTSRITVTLLDRFGNPVSGKRVHLEVLGGSRNFPQDPTVPTNAQGKAFGFLRSLTSGEKIIKARVVDDAKLLKTQASVIFLANNATKIASYFGGGQTANVGTLLKDSLVIKITDANDNPVRFGPVRFEVTGGGGSLFGPSNAVSDSMGLASTRLVVGPNPGENVVRATSGTLQGSPLYFSATGVAGSPVAMRSVSGSGQRGAAGEPLPLPFTVQVVDKSLRPVSAVDVLFAVTVGKGVLVTPQPVKTDAFGYARAILRTDSVSGQTCWVEARNASLSGSPQRFSAVSTAGPARRLLLVSGDRQYGFVGETLGAPLVAKTTDRYNNAVAGVSVRFEIVRGDASFGGPTAVTVPSDGSGRAAAVLTLGLESGPVTVEATSAFLEGSPVTFHLTAQTIQAETIEKFAGDNQKGRVGLPLVEPLRVVVLDSHGNRVPGTGVNFLKTSGGGAILESQPVVSDSNGIASVNFISASSPGTSTVAVPWTNKTLTFSIETVVNPSNPILDKALIQPSYDIYESDDLIIPLVGSDADGNSLVFEIANLFPPAGAVIQAQSSTTAVFRWSPNYNQAGTYTFVLRVNDGRGGADTDTTSIHVMNLNREPVVLSKMPAGQDTSAYTGQKLSFLVNARDPDDDPLVFFWKMDGVVVGSDLPFFEWTPEKTDIGSHTVDCFISDGFVSVTRRWNIQLETAVEMTALAAAFDEEKVLVRVEWATLREVNNTGFEVYRSTDPAGDYRKVSGDLIPSLRGGDYAFEDASVQVGRTYYYKIADVDAEGARHENGPLSVTVPVPKRFALSQNYPNPFNPVTVIRYQVPTRQRVQLSVYNTLGRQVRILADREHDPGFYTEKWDGRDADGTETPAGLYLYRITGAKEHRTLKMVKLK